MRRDASAWVLGATAVAMALLVATASAGDLEDDIEGLWESTGGDIMRKLVTDMENDPIAAGRKMVRAAASMRGSYRRAERVCRHAPRPTRQLAGFRHRLARCYFLVTKPASRRSTALRLTRNVRVRVGTRSCVCRSSSCAATTTALSGFSCLQKPVASSSR